LPLRPVAALFVAFVLAADWGLLGAAAPDPACLPFLPLPGFADAGEVFLLPVLPPLLLLLVPASWRVGAARKEHPAMST
jgi:hypothetical protein